MKEKLAGKDYLFIGSMLFGLFFGAGNLIFPIHMGQEAGDAISQANFGFLVTAVGFPFLGIIALGISQSNVPSCRPPEKGSLNLPTVPIPASSYLGVLTIWFFLHSLS